MALVRPAAPSHQIHSIYNSFSLMHAGGGLSAHGASGHGLSLFVPPELSAPPPAPSRRASSSNHRHAPADRSRGAAPPPMPVGPTSKRTAPRRAPPPPPPSSSSRNPTTSTSTPCRKSPPPPPPPAPASPAPPAPTEAIVEEDPFADHVTVYTTPRHPTPAPRTRGAESRADPSLRDPSVRAAAPARSAMLASSHPVLSYATIHAHAMEASRRAAQAERERRARIVASILLTRAARAGAHPLRRRPSTEEQPAKSYVSSSLKTMVAVA